MQQRPKLILLHPLCCVTNVQHLFETVHVSEGSLTVICVCLSAPRTEKLCLSDNSISQPRGKFRNESKSNLEPLIGCLFSEMKHRHYSCCWSIIDGPEVFWPCGATKCSLDDLHILQQIRTNREQLLFLNTLTESTVMKWWLKVYVSTF